MQGDNEERLLGITRVQYACLSLKLYCNVQGIISNQRTIFHIPPLSKIQFLFRRLMVLKMSHQEAAKHVSNVEMFFLYFFQVINTWHLGNVLLNLQKHIDLFNYAHCKVPVTSINISYWTDFCLLVWWYILERNINAWFTEGGVAFKLKFLKEGSLLFNSLPLLS